VLKLSWFCIVPLLPSELLCETVPEPDVDVGYMVFVQNIKLATLKDFSALEVSMH
jgi:hypothetical protein